MEFPTLLAKSKLKSQSQAKTLVKHTEDVLDAAEALFGTRKNLTRLGEQWIKLFQVTDADLFMRSLTAAATLHDLGKANHDFQKAVSGKSDGQLIRHEHLSGILMQIPAMRNWLEQQKQVDWDVVLSAVVCHHLKASEETLNCSGNTTKTLAVYSDHQDFARLLNLVKSAMELPEVEFLLPGKWSSKKSPPVGYESIEKHIAALKGYLADFDWDRRNNKDRERLLLAVRAALIVADAAGSGLPRNKKSIPEWIAETFVLDGLLDSNAIEKKVIFPRVKQIELSGKKFRWNDFQEDTAKLPSRALLLAPCGSGKTLAAWRWIKAQSANGVRHCLFLYPTRATATEGFRDYVSWAPDAEAALMHGTAAYELEGLFQNSEANDSRGENDFETEQRMFAIGYWPKRIFSATVDQFFSFLSYSYSGMCLLPVLADSVLVIDEVHSFDDSMFQSLKDFLKEFPEVPVLCMTATLPQRRCEELESCGLSVLDAYQKDFKDLKKVANAPRYKIRCIEESEADGIVQRELKHGRKVLWVVNTVARAQAIARRFSADISADELATKDGVPVYCYHSRYRLCDRQDRHREVVEAFQKEGSRAVLAITTQVCEMGLDLDADVLITETAPVTSLIQRMGRCNRAPKPRPSAGDVFISHSEKPRPYEEDDLRGVAEFLQRAATGQPITQYTLETIFGEIPQPKGQQVASCLFLRSGSRAMSGVDSFRQIEEFKFTLPTILQSDVATVLDLLKKGKPIDGCVLPVPNTNKFRDPPEPGMPKYLGIAHPKYYLPNLGFCDEPLSQGAPPLCPPLIV